MVTQLPPRLVRTMATRIRPSVAFIALIAWMIQATADPAAAATGVAIGSLDRSPLPASTQYVLRSTVFEQLRSRGVPTMDMNNAPYVYLARVGIENVDDGCIYRVTANLVPNSTDTPAARPSLWSREFTSAVIACDGVAAEMTKTLDGFALEFARDSAKGLVHADTAAAKK